MANNNYKPAVKANHLFRTGSSSKRTNTKKPSPRKSIEEPKPISPSSVENFSMTVGKGDNQRNMSVRAISNGFIVSENGSKGKGDKRTWYQKEKFSQKMPDINMMAKGKFKF